MGYKLSNSEGHGPPLSGSYPNKNGSIYPASTLLTFTADKGPALEPIELGSDEILQWFADQTKTVLLSEEQLYEMGKSKIAEIVIPD